MSAHFTTPTDELLLLAETLGEVKTKADKLEAEFATQARPLEAATNALSAALSGIKALQFHVLDNNLGALSARVEEMRKAVDEQVGVIALELKKADETNAAKAGQDAEALRSQIAALQAQLGTLGAQFSAQLERVEFSAKEEAKKLQLIPGPAGAAGASLNPRGTFIDGETYNRLDVVSWLGSSYIAAVDGVTEKPSKNSNQWQVLASRGSGGAGGAGDFGSLAGVAQINQGGTGQTTRAAGLNALLPSQTGNVQYMLLTDGAGTVSWGAQPVAGLPSQTGNSGELLTTDGVNASWSNAVTVSGSNATVTGTLTVNSTSTFTGNATFSGSTLWLNDGGGGTFNFVNGSTVANTLRLGIGNTNQVLITDTKTSILATTASTSTSSGALVVSGGVGVGGAIFAGGNIQCNAVFAANNTTLYLRPSGASVSSGQTTIETSGIMAVSGMVKGAAATFSGQPPTGVSTAFQVDVENATTRDLFCFGDSTRAGLLRGAHDGSGRIQWAFGRYTGGAFAEYVRIEGVASTDAKLTINGTTASTSTSSGALVVSGGVGVAGAVFTGGYVHPGGDSTFYIRGTGSNNGLIRGNVTSVDIDSSFSVRNGDGSSTYLSVASTGLIAAIPAAAPSLAVNGTMTFERTSNTSLKISLRGTDGTTRSVSLTLT